MSQDVAANEGRENEEAIAVGRAICRRTLGYWNEHPPKVCGSGGRNRRRRWTGATGAAASGPRKNSGEHGRPAEVIVAVTRRSSATRRLRR